MFRNSIERENLGYVCFFFNPVEENAQIRCHRAKSQWRPGKRRIERRKGRSQSATGHPATSLALELLCGPRGIERPLELEGKGEKKTQLEGEENRLPKRKRMRYRNERPRRKTKNSNGRCNCEEMRPNEPKPNQTKPNQVLFTIVRVLARVLHELALISNTHRLQ